MYSDDEDDGEHTGGRAPLLTGIEAPSVRVAEDLDTSEFLEGARPKSGMKMAFMNMANSIMWVSPKVVDILRLTATEVQEL